MSIFFAFFASLRETATRRDAKIAEKQPEITPAHHILEITGDYCYYFIVENSITESRHVP
jgi:hypothetical protein